MRYNLFLLYIALLVPACLLAQNDDRRDYVWVLGYPPNLPAQGFGGSRIDFNFSPSKVSYFHINYEYKAISMICNEKGELAFSTNGCHILNRNHQIMENGSPLNEGPVFDGYCGTGGYPAAQPIICLPYPGHPDQYVVFHIRVELTNVGVWYRNVLSTVVDMSKNGGLGAVLERNIQLAQGDVGQNNFTQYITATRHGNGRDWWIAAPTYYGKKTYLFLLTPKGVEGPYIRQNPQGLEFWAAGQIGFSPDGTWFCEGVGKSLFRLSRFDRCSGEFYDQRVYDFQTDTVYGMGVSFSPTSRFLYISQPLKIYQYDLSAPDLQASRQVVAKYDGFAPNGFSTTFFQAMLAPDDKIYLTAGNSTQYLHIIHAPDSLGTACRVQQHGLGLATRHAFMVPNFPYFRLYDLPGSACDTLGINGPVSAVPPEPSGQVREPVTFYPNPSTGEVFWTGTGAVGQRVWVYSATGQRVLEQQPDVAGYADLSGLPDGLYWVLLLDEAQREVGRGKVLLLRE